MVKMSFNTTPTYNLKVVIQETNIKPDTLRAWERRYGLPEPERTQGKHRLYSEHDIAIIKWLIERQQEGLSISKAVQLWRHMNETGQNPLDKVAPPLSAHTFKEDSTTVRTAVQTTGSTLIDLRQGWINACLNFNEAAAENILTQAFALYPADMVCLELLQKSLAQIGEMWYRNEATVQQEHFASALAMRRLNTLVTASPQPNRPGKIIVACPAHEHHVFAPLFLTLMLRHRGWETIYLGADVPRDYLKETVASTRPDLIIMTAQQLHTAAALFEAAEVLDKARIPLAYGGRIFSQTPMLRRRITGHFLGEQLEGAMQAVAHILSKKPLTPERDPIPDSYQLARRAFRQNQAALEAAVWNMLQGEEFPYEHITNANLHLARDIGAALTLGSVSFLGDEMAWVETLLLNYEMPEALLRRYLQVYYQAARQALPPEGAPVLEWLACITGSDESSCD
jgi:MerR family transcriptional regulator, light-induced transcriptional regulator